jgi:hypothetical protein
MANPAEKSLYFNKFSQYMAASCWRKMHIRVTTWWSQGFLYFLCQYRDADVRGACNYTQEDRGEPLRRKDTVLANYFLGLKTSGLLGCIMKEHPNPTHRLNPLIHLSDAFKKAQSSKMAVSIYDENTCYEFHAFLVALILAYMKSSKALSQKRDRTCGYAFFNLAIILWKVARSNILRIHLETLHAAAEAMGLFLGMPQVKWRTVYSKCLEGQGLDIGDKQVEGEKGEAGEGQAEFGGKGVDEERGGYDDDSQDAELQDFQQLLDGVITHNMKTDPPSVYQGWLVLLISHFESLDILSTFCARTYAQGGESMQAMLLNVRPHDKVLPMVDWKELVLELAEPEPELSAKAGLITREQAKAAVALVQERIDGSSVKDVLNTSQCDLRLRSSGVHCEAAMASLMKYHDLANCSITLPCFEVRSYLHQYSLP